MGEGGGYVSLGTPLPYDDLQNPTFVEADNNDDDVSDLMTHIIFCCLKTRQSIRDT